MSYKRGLAIVFGCAIAGIVAFAATHPRFYSATVASPAASAPSGASAGSDANVSPLAEFSFSSDSTSWNCLTEAQRVALAPFARQWDSFSDERKQKWLKIASRYHKMSAESQERLHRQMEEWVKMTPDERKVARENYQVSKSVPLDKREKAWDAYQKLTEEQKKKLAATERTRRQTVVSAPPTGKTEVKDINRLVAQREHASATSGQVPAAASSEPLASAAPAQPAIPNAASIVPATPLSVRCRNSKRHRFKWLVTA
ncbi:putative transmembrane protein [Candidatus Burkholderia pumila]|uniref:Transmembrane protein n=1 Tax=Candidatus Burkholderia pumila TaxID=1090375 RepID=A0ABR5HMV5_9BURK|nr:putative transmembrane protein [Candidatus Burkholderia pumila]